MDKKEFDNEISKIASLNRQDSIIHELAKYEIYHIESFKSDFNSYIQVFEVWFQLITESIEVINYLKKDTRKLHNTHQFLLIKNNLETLYSIFNNISKWLYQASFNSARTYIETIIRLLFASYNKEDHTWMIHKDWKPWSTKLNITDFLKNKLKNEELMWSYDLLSKFSHSNIFDFIKDYRKESNFHNFNMEYSTDKIKLNLNYMFFFLYFTLEFINTIFFRESYVNMNVKRDIEKSWFYKKLETYKISLAKILKDVDLDKKNFYNLTCDLIKQLDNLENNLTLWKQ